MKWKLHLSSFIKELICIIYYLSKWFDDFLKKTNILHCLNRIETGRLIHSFNKNITIGNCEAKLDC